MVDGLVERPTDDGKRKSRELDEERKSRKSGEAFKPFGTKFFADFRLLYTYRLATQIHYVGARGNDIAEECTPSARLSLEMDFVSRAMSVALESHDSLDQRATWAGVSCMS